jgi:uncharacterized protein
MPTASQRLIYAVRTGNYERLAELLKQPDAVKERSEAGRTALHAAAEEGDLQAARILVEAGADVNARTRDGATPLQLAAGYGRAIDLMDADLDRRDCLARSRHNPMSKEVAVVVSDLMKKKNPRIPADLGVTDDFPEENRWDIFSAGLDVFAEPAELLKEIAAHGIDIDQVDPAFAEFLRGNPRYIRVAEFLLQHGAEVNNVNEQGETALSAAVECGRVEMVELLLKRGADLKLPRINEDEEPDSIVWKALEYWKVDVAEILWKHGAELPNAWQLNYLAGNGQEKGMIWAIERGLDVNTRDEKGNTPILSAADNGHHDNIAALLRLRADYHVRNKSGDSLVHKAAAWPKCLEVVLPLGLDINAQNQSGRTPLHNAAQSGDYYAVPILIRAGASPNIQDREGNTPLHLIFESEEYRPDVEFPVFLELVAGGADRAIRNAAGKTPADVAAEVRYPEEYLQLLNPVAARPARNFIWLWEEPFRDFLPTAMIGIDLDGASWPSVQHYFHAQKTTDSAVREHIRAAATPEDALLRFRESKAKQSANWNTKCDAIMRRALLAKFQQHKILHEILLGTNDATLVSDSNCDSYWLERNGVQFNTLGRMIMEIRSELRALNSG